MNPGLAAMIVGAIILIAGVLIGMGIGAHMCNRDTEVAYFTGYRAAMYELDDPITKIALGFDAGNRDEAIPKSGGAPIPGAGEGEDVSWNTVAHVIE